MELYRLPENAAGRIDVLNRQQNGTDYRPIAAAHRHAVEKLVKQPLVKKPHPEGLRQRGSGRERGSRRRRRRYRRRRSGRSAGGDQGGQQD